MKIRTGFVSNSSSTSFTIPSALLTYEQKEMLLSIDTQKESKAKLNELASSVDGDYNFENSKNDYPKNEEYHRIYDTMVEDGEWHDHRWDTSESKYRKTIEGTASMGNGSIEEFMKKIGIDPTMVEMVNHGHLSVYMATHPDAIKHHIWLYEELKKDWASKEDQGKQFIIGMGGSIPDGVSPYALDDSEFETFGENRLEYQKEGNEEGYSYMRDKKNED